MSINRTYGDNGKLLRVEMSKEMKERGGRYANKCKRNAVLDAVMPYVVIVASVSFLTVWYLINN